MKPRGMTQTRSTGTAAIGTGTSLTLAAVAGNSITGALSGAGSLALSAGASSSLTLTADCSISTFTASANPNTVTYNKSVSPPQVLCPNTTAYHHLTLSGAGPWQYQKEEAERALTVLTGVKGIKNEIQLRPAPR